MKSISIVIPAFNEEEHIAALLDSVNAIDYPVDQFEVIVVSDGSTDATTAIVKGFPGTRLIDLPKNIGRYKCREAGARASKYPYVLFLDARSTIPPNILTILNQLNAQVVTGYVEGASTPGPFETFYRAIRRKVFRQFFRQFNTPLHLTSKNFDSMPKGTGVLFIDREVLFQAYRELSAVEMGHDSSDDTRLLHAVVNQVPILLHPAVKITYVSRASFVASVKHLWRRGAKFVDYYLDPAKKLFWWGIIFPSVLLLAVLLGFAFLPLHFGVKIAALASLDVLITLILASSIRDFFIILLMAPLCGLVFTLGMLRGLLLQVRKRAKTRSPNPIQPSGG